MTTSAMDVGTALKHENPLIRIWAISQRPDNQLLLECVCHDDELAIRLYALETLHDQVCLAKVIMSRDAQFMCYVDAELFADNDVPIRVNSGSSTAQVIKSKALTKVRGLETLKKFLSRETRVELVKLAVERINDDATLIEIVDSDASCEVVEFAWEKISTERKTTCFHELKTSRAQCLVVPFIQDREELMHLVGGEYDWEVKFCALDQIHETQTYAKIALSGSFETDIRCEAVRRISDVRLLQDIAVSTDIDTVFGTAIGQLDDQDALLSLVMKITSMEKTEEIVRHLDQSHLVEMASRYPTQSNVRAIADRIRTPQSALAILKTHSLAPYDVALLCDLVEDPSELKEFAERSAANEQNKAYAKWRLSSRVVSALAEQEKLDDILALLRNGWSADFDTQSPALPFPEISSDFFIDFDRANKNRVTGLVSNLKCACNVYTSGQARSPLHLVLCYCAIHLPVLQKSQANKSMEIYDLTVTHHTSTAQLISDIGSSLLGSPEDLNTRMEYDKNKLERREAEIKKAKSAAQSDIIDKMAELFRLVLEAGAPVNIQDENGATPLHVAMQLNQQVMPRKLIEDGFVNPLLDRGARTDLVDKQGRSALDVATSREGAAPEEKFEAFKDRDRKILKDNASKCWSPSDANRLLRLMS